MRATFVILSFAFILSASAHTEVKSNEKCKDKQTQPKEDKVLTLPAQLNYFEEDALKQESIQIEAEQKSPIIPTKVDTTSSTISKYNYLFYFIYKYKYENKFGVDQIERLITD